MTTATLDEVFCVGRAGKRGGRLRDIRVLTTPEMIRAAVSTASPESRWVLRSGGLLRDFVSALHSRPHFGRLLVCVGEPRGQPGGPVYSTLAALSRSVVGGLEGFRWLPPEELWEVLASRDPDLFLGGISDPLTETVTLVRSTFDTLPVRFSSFVRASPAATPDFSRLSVTDHGQTVRLGDYEAAADAILYELDPAYRRKLRARRRAEERGFGPGLRRLRKQRGLRRSDFPGLSARTIARIESGRSTRLHRKTREVIGRTLGVPAEAIADW